MPSFLRFLILAAAIVLPRLALADGPLVACSADMMSGCLVVHSPPVHRSTGDPDLNRAMAWCDANMADEYYNGSMGGSPLWGYKDERCRRVEKAWENSSSEKARREAEEAAKKAADEAWLDSYVKGLPK